MGELVPVSGGRFRSLVVEFQWENGAPIGDMDLAVYAADLIFVASSMTSPIQRVLGEPDLPDGPVDLAMEYAGMGAYVDFKGTVWFSAFETPEPPSGYTAIP